MLCDQVIDDRNSGKKTLVGIFNHIYANNFPARHPMLAAYVALTNGQGDVRVGIVLRREDASPDEKPLFTAGTIVKFANPNVVVELIFNVLGLTFATPGQYVVEVRADEEYIFENKFEVKHLKQFPQPPQPPRSS